MASISGRNFIYMAAALLYINTTNAFTSADTSLYEKNPNYKHELELYEIYKLKQADIVMLGNSGTHGANWNELLGRGDVAERGIPGDIVEGYLNRLFYITSLKPKVVFIQGGLNDVYNWIPIEKIFKDYTAIIKRLEEEGIIVVIQSTTFASRKYPYSEDRNKETAKLNKLLQNYSEKNKIKFIDLNSKLCNEKFLKDEYTYDGIHFTARGFKIWGREVEKVLKELGL